MTIEKEETKIAQEIDEDDESSKTKKKSPKKKGKVGSNTTTTSFKGKTAALKDHVFIYHQLHDKKWIRAKQEFISYASRTYGGDEETSLEQGKLTIITMDEPSPPTATEMASMDDTEKEFARDDYKTDRKAYKDLMVKTKKNLSKLYAVLWGQCDPIMQNKMRAVPGYEDAQLNKSVIDLLSIIETVCEQGDLSRNRRVQRFISRKKVYNLRQTDDMDLGEYLEKFQALVNVAEKNGALFYESEDVEDAMMEAGLQRSETIMEPPPIIKTETTKEGETTTKQEEPTPEPRSAEIPKEIIEQARDRALAIIFFMNSNDNKYGVYKQECHNAMAKGRDEYPKTVTAAHTALEDYKFNPRLYQIRNVNNYNKTRFSGHQFLVDSGPVEDSPGKRKQKEEYYCYNCGRKNECMAYDCPHKTKENGAPTRAERRRLREEGESVDSGDQHLQETDSSDAADEQSEYNDWELELDGDDYGIGFYMNAEPEDKILVEDLRGKNKHAFNQCKHRLNPRWILIDNCSSVNVFYNKRFLQNIRKADKALHLYTNAGKAIITMIGDLPGFGEVYYYPKGIANILSFHIVTNMPGYTVEYNNAIEDAFNVTNKNGEKRKFVPSQKGLYYWDSSTAIAKQAAESFAEVDIEAIAVDTVQGNKAKYSKRDNERANKVRLLQNITNWSDADMMRITKYGSLLNNPFNPRDITITRAILGPSISGLQGKTIRQKRKEVEGHLVPVPRQVMDHYQDITLSLDIMHVNTIPFLVTISKHIHYGTATPLQKMTEEIMYSVLTDLDKFYKKRGFKIGLILADKQFECLDNEVAELEILMNIAAQDEHVPEVERYIRVIKERARSALSNTPFGRIPSRMVIGLITGVLFYMNGTPWEKGVSKILSPMTIVTGRKLDYRLHCRVPFGAYAQVRRGTDNTMREQTFGGIAMGPMNNMQGGMTFMSLLTGRKVERDKSDFTILPMPDEVIVQVETMAKQSPNGLIFGDDTSNATQPDDVELTTDNHETEKENDESTTSDADIDQDSVNDDVESTGVAETSEEINSENTGVDQHENDELDGQAIIDNQDEEIEFMAQSDDENEINTDDEEQEESEITDDDSVKELRRSERTTSRPVYRGFEDAFVHVQVLQSGIEQCNYNRAMCFLHQASERCHDKVSHHLMTQYGLKAGLKKFGKEGQEATTKEMKQMLSREVFEEIEYSTLTNKDKQLALPILLFLTQKRDGSIKGRACADGRKQRIWMQKEDTKSPTVSTEGLFYLLMLDAYEGREVATLDLPGHFLQTPMEGRLILRVDGELATALIDLDKGRWEKHLQTVRGRPVIFVKCSKAIYGTLNAALLSYKKLIGHLSEWGFEMNLYDHCVWNKDIDNKQMTVAFHVDDMKISHVNPKEVTGMIERLRGIYGKTDPMTVTRGKIHEYLGMTIDFTTPKEVKITMYDYVQKMINDLAVDMIGTRMTAAPDYLFHTSDGTDDTKKLDADARDYFHTMTARALYLGKRARPDLQTAVAFLCTRVREPDEHDYKKLGHLMKYLQETRHMPLILRYNGKEISLYIDGAHAVHGDMRGHVGVMATGGRGTLYASSTKTKLNTVSSTETEIVSVGEKLPKHIWFRYFRIAQGGNSGEDILYQDNEAAILLEKNGRMSCGKGSKHINIRYFFITDKINRKEIKVQYCPTKEMIADYFTKPLQGGLFRKFRNLILGVRDENIKQYKQEYQQAIDKFGLNVRTDDQS